MPKPPRCQKCAFYNVFELEESGHYLSVSQSDDKGESMYRPWFCCIMHRHMWKHTRGISTMSRSTYEECLKADGYYKRNHKTVNEECPKGEMDIRRDSLSS